jgi:Pyruvate/2-oxoacid:ferredoxin oxidoreductase delta subunit
MSVLKEKAIHVTLVEGENAVPLDAASRFEAMRTLLDKGYRVSRGTSVSAEDRDEREVSLAIGRFENDAPEGVRNIAGMDAGGIADLVESARAEADAVQPGEWKPWFPVIDYDRCTNCMQCLSFCLFGVYGVSDDQQIQVQSNDNCKTNCPACSRVCPEAAIMFPKYKAGPINGDTVSSSDLNREKMKVDISSLLGGDVYSLLRDRSAKAKSRFSKERDSGKALNERQKCLVKLANSGDIPAEVLMSLPSPDEIQRRAAEATAKARAALAAANQDD